MHRCWIPTRDATLVLLSELPKKLILQTQLLSVMGRHNYKMLVEDRKLYNFALNKILLQVRDMLSLQSVLIFKRWKMQ